MNSKLKKNISSGKFMEDKDKSVTESKGKAKSYNEAKNKNKKDNMVGNDKSTSAIEEREDIVIGRNAVIEALRGERTIETLYISNSKLEGSIKTIVGLAKENKILIKEVDKRKLDSMCGGEVHQGVIAKVTPYKYSEVSDILDLAEKRGEAPFIVILDEVEDPHNLGSIVRTAELFGVHGIILPKRRSASVSITVYKSSVGAIEHVKIAKVTNLNSTIEELKEKGSGFMGQT